MSKPPLHYGELWLGPLKVGETHVLCSRINERYPERAYRLRYWEAFSDGLNPVGRMLVMLGVITLTIANPLHGRDQ